MLSSTFPCHSIDSAASTTHKNLLAVAFKNGLFQTISYFCWKFSLSTALHLATLVFLDHFMHDPMVPEPEHDEALQLVQAEFLTSYENALNGKIYELYSWSRMCHVCIRFGTAAWNLTDRWHSRAPFMLSAIMAPENEAKMTQAASQDEGFCQVLQQLCGLTPENLWEAMKSEVNMAIAATVIHVTSELGATGWDTRKETVALLFDMLSGADPAAIVTVALLTRPLPYNTVTDGLGINKLASIFPADGENDMLIKLSKILTALYGIEAGQARFYPYFTMASAILELYSNLSRHATQLAFFKKFSSKFIDAIKIFFSVFKPTELVSFPHLYLKRGTPLTCIVCPLVSATVFLHNIGIVPSTIIPQAAYALLDPNSSLKVAGNDLYVKGFSKAAVVPYSCALEIASLISEGKLSGFAASGNTLGADLILNNRSQCFIHMKKFAQALSDATKSLHINPTNEKTRARRDIAAKEVSQKPKEGPMPSVEELYPDRSGEKNRSIAAAFSRADVSQRAPALKRVIDDIAAIPFPSKASQLAAHLSALQGFFYPSQHIPFSIEMWKSGGVNTMLDLYIKTASQLTDVSTQAERDAVMLTGFILGVIIYGLPKSLFEKLQDVFDDQLDLIVDALCNLFSLENVMVSAAAQIFASNITKLNPPSVCHNKNWLTRILPAAARFMLRVQSNATALYDQAMKEPMFYDFGISRSSRDRVTTDKKAEKVDEQKRSWQHASSDIILRTCAGAYYDDDFQESMSLIRSEPSIAAALISVGTSGGFFEHDAGSVPRACCEALALIFQPPSRLSSRNSVWLQSVSDLVRRLLQDGCMTVLAQYFAACSSGGHVWIELGNAAAAGKTNSTNLHNFINDLSILGQILVLMTTPENVRPLLKPKRGAADVFSDLAMFYIRTLMVTPAAPQFKATISRISQLALQTYGMGAVLRGSQRNEITNFYAVINIMAIQTVLGQRLFLSAAEAATTHFVIEGSLVQAFNQLVSQNIQQKLYEPALAQLTLLLELLQDFPTLRAQTLRSRAEVQAKLQRFEAAIEDLEESLVLEPSNAAAKSSLQQLKAKLASQRSPAANQPPQVQQQQPAQQAASQQALNKKKKKKKAKKAGGASMEPAPADSELAADTKYSISCHLCKYRQSDTAAMCGHVWCAQCGASLKNCPFCAAKVEKTFRIYL